MGCTKQEFLKAVAEGDKYWDSFAEDALESPERVSLALALVRDVLDPRDVEDSLRQDIVSWWSRMEHAFAEQGVRECDRPEEYFYLSAAAAVVRGSVRWAWFRRIDLGRFRGEDSRRLSAELLDRARAWAGKRFPEYTEVAR